jgi:hypothetical protein
MIFLTYINRSGSTYLAQILSVSEEILVCPEAEILVEKFLEAPEKNFILTDTLRNELIQQINNDWKLRHWDLRPEDLESLSKASNNFDAFFLLLCIYRDRIKPAATKILFKAERILHLWEKLEKLYRGDNLLHLIAVVRDPRGIYASQKNTRWPGSEKPFSDNPVHSCLFWRRYVKEVQRLLILHSEISIIRYEDLLNKPEETLEYLTQKIRIKRIPFLPEKGDLDSRIPEDQKHLHGNIKAQPVREKEKEWQGILNNYEIDLIQIMTNKYMNKLGYATEIRKVSLFKLIKTILPQTITYYISFNSKRIVFWIIKIIHGKGSL